MRTVTRELALVIVLCLFVALSYFQDSVILKQRKLIKEMMRNPACMVDIPSHLPNKDVVVTEN